MRTVSARDANQMFSKLLAAVEAGEEVVITKRGRRVARITSVRDEKAETERAAAARRLMALLEKGLPLGVGRFSRQEIYDERADELDARRERARARG